MKVLLTEQQEQRIREQLEDADLSEIWRDYLQFILSISETVTEFPQTEPHPVKGIDDE